MKLIIRKRYLKRLDFCRGTPDIKVITGIRRCGKSKLLESFASKVQQEEPDCNIIKININNIGQHVESYDDQSRCCCR